MCIVTAEQEALALAANKRQLRRRLQDTHACLSTLYARRFGKGRFDFAGRRLIGANGLVLQWRTRQYPHQPEGPGNQQTTRGIVICLLETADNPTTPT